MITPRWAIICRDVIINSATNNLSLIEQIDQIQVALSPPTDVPIPIGLNHVTIALWDSDEDVPEPPPLRLSLFGPDNVAIFEQAVPFDFFGTRRTRTIINHAVFPYRGVGTYRYTFAIGDGDDWTDRISCMLAVLSAPDQTDPAPTLSSGA